MKTKLWSVGNGEWILHIRKGLKRRFESEFKNIGHSALYHDDKMKLKAVDYKFYRDEYLNKIKKWLKENDK